MSLIKHGEGQVLDDHERLGEPQGQPPVDPAEPVDIPVDVPDDDRAESERETGVEPVVPAGGSDG